MPRRQRTYPNAETETEFVIADLRTGFALLDLAEDESLFGTPEGVCHAVQQAESACRDGQWRVMSLGDRQFHQFEPQLEKLLRAIDGIKKRVAFVP